MLCQSFDKIWKRPIAHKKSPRGSSSRAFFGPLQLVLVGFLTLTGFHPVLVGVAILTVLGLTLLGLTETVFLALLILLVLLLRVLTLLGLLLLRILRVLVRHCLLSSLGGHRGNPPRQETVPLEPSHLVSRDT